MEKSVTMNKVREKIQHLDEEKMYHVCQAWDGGDLLSLYEQLGEEAYGIFAQKHGIDNKLGIGNAHFVHCHYTVEEAKEYQRIWGGQILEINARDLAVKHDCLEYPHPMVRGVIPKEYVRRIKETKEGLR
jgi:hypothetical protein